MKKVILSLLLILSITSLFAQRRNVTRARNLAQMENPDFNGAREAIALALKDSSTYRLPNTWFVAGLIGYKQNEAFNKEMFLGRQIDFVRKGEVIVESMNYLLKAYELDQNQVDRRGRPVKPRFDASIKAKIKEYYEERHNLFTYGAVLFDERKDYKRAVEAFEIFLSIPHIPFMKGVVNIDSTYYQVKYFTALAARNAGMLDKAIAIHEEMKDGNYEVFFVYQLLYDQYTQLNDTANFIRVLKEGFAKMPEEPWFLQNLINYYLLNDYIEESKHYINIAIQLLPEVAVYHYVKAKISEAEGNAVEARKSYERTLELDPTFADAYAGLGGIIVDEGQKILDEAALKSNREFNAARVRSRDYFQRALTFFQKAHELKPEEISYKRNLRTLYYRLDMNEEFEAMERALGLK